MAELIDKKLVLKDIATWAVGGNPEEPEMVRMDELAMAMGVSVGRIPTTTEAEIRAMAIDEFAEKLCVELSEKAGVIKVHGVDFDILTVDGATEILLDLAEQLKEE